MADTPLARAIEIGRKKLGLSKSEYARRVGLSLQGIDYITTQNKVNGSTLARLQRNGGVRVTPRLIASLDAA